MKVWVGQLVDKAGYWLEVGAGWTEEAAKQNAIAAYDAAHPAASAAGQLASGDIEAWAVERDLPEPPTSTRRDPSVNLINPGARQERDRVTAYCGRTGRLVAGGSDLYETPAAGDFQAVRLPLGPGVSITCQVCARHVEDTL